MTSKILINHKIPSTMSQAGLKYLGKIAQTVPKNGVIVEIGPLFGSSTWVLAKNAHPSVTIYSIDTWEPASWIDKVEERYKNCIPFSKDAFLEYTKDCPNVKAIQGWSPDVVSDWDRPIDVFFDDATHGDPGFSANLDFFLPFIRSTGVICGDDYSGGWPDIVRVVDSLGKKWRKQPEVIGRVWSLTQAEPDSPNFVADKLVKNHLPKIIVSTTSVDGTNYKLPPPCWSGALHKSFPLSSINLALDSTESGLGFEWRVSLSTCDKAATMSSGDEYRVTGSQRITGIYAKLTGPNANKYDLEYQVGFCWGKGKGKRYPLSAAVSQGNTIEAKDSGVAINAIRFVIFDRKAHRSEKLKLKLAKLRNYSWRTIIKKTGV